MSFIPQSITSEVRIDQARGNSQDGAEAEVESEEGVRDSEGDDTGNIDTQADDSNVLVNQRPIIISKQWCLNCEQNTNAIFDC